MMRYFSLVLVILCFSCNNQRVLQLPEIESAEITEVLDVSPAYIFYDLSQTDSTLLNRKNLISTTNWLVNVDKRLTLRQAMPHIKFLQDKKRNAELHKNENAKNYFTCNATSIGNLGFIAFTNVTYKLRHDKIDLTSNEFISAKDFQNKSFLKQKSDSLKQVRLFSSSAFREIDLKFGFGKYYYINTTRLEEDVFFHYLDYITDDALFYNSLNLKLHFKNSMSFQKYITIKSKILKLSSEHIRIDTNEFIFD